MGDAAEYHEQIAETQAAEPAAIAEDAIAGMPARARAAFATPAEDVFEAPLGCSFGKYAQHVRAFLPEGVLRQGKNSCSRNYGSTRPLELAYAEVRAWLDGAVAAGVVACCVVACVYYTEPWRYATLPAWPVTEKKSAVG